MAEFLIYNKEHWMDTPSKQRPDLTGYENVIRKINEDTELNVITRTEKLGNVFQKYNRRYQPGDIVEVRKDGKGMCGLEPESFALIEVPISFEIAQEYMQSDKVINEPCTILHRRKYWLDISGIVLNKDKIATIDLVTFNSILKVKK